MVVTGEMMERDKNLATDSTDNTEKSLSTNCTNKSIYYEVLKGTFKDELVNELDEILTKIDISMLPKNLNTTISMTFEGDTLVTYNVSTKRVVLKTNRDRKSALTYVKAISEEQYKQVVGE